MKILSQDKDEAIIKADVTFWTDKAVCIEDFEGEKCFIPLSQIEILEMNTSKTEIEMVVPRWIAEAKELI